MNRPVLRQIAGATEAPAQQAPRLLASILLILFGFMLCGLESQAQQLRMRCGTFDPLKDPMPIIKLPANPQASLQSAGTNLGKDESRLVLIQWATPLDNKKLNILAQQGVRLILPVPDHAYLAAVPSTVDLNNLNKVGLMSADQAPRWSGPLTPALKLHPQVADFLTTSLSTVSLNGATTNTQSALKPYSVQVALTGGEKAVHATMESLCPSIHLMFTGKGFETWYVEATAETIATLAQLNSVMWIEPYRKPKSMEERGGLSLAGIMNGGGTAAINPGTYKNWLQQTGLSGAGIIVQVIDDGLSQGDASNKPGTAHPDIVGRIAGIDNATSDLTGDSANGHGHLNASIIMGQPLAGGGNMKDEGNFLLGQGVAPEAKVFATKIIPDGVRYVETNRTIDSLVQVASAAGATVSNNSWGGDTFGEYDIMDQAFDYLTRDADLTKDGDQAMTFCFSAGNSGSATSNGLYTIASPASAKNVISVGASENSDKGELDGSDVAPVSSDNMRDIAFFSSRGPSRDGRLLPTVVAPGTHITGAASDSPDYNGSGVSGRVTQNLQPGESPDAIKYYPANQKYYTWSSGTSHSCPVVSGAVALFQEFYKKRFGMLPSPAMTKAALIAGAVDPVGGNLNTRSGGILSNIPNNHAGWGRANLDNIVNFPNDQFFIDQTQVFTANGQSYSQSITVSDPSKPLRISLVWTDPPGAINGGRALVNNLDLIVSDGTSTWLGNVFANGMSVTGGTADEVNNIECVFLPNPAPGVYTVTVTAKDMTGAALPEAGYLSQDFALYAQNAAQNDPVGKVSFDRPIYALKTPVMIGLSDSDLRYHGTAQVTVTNLSGDKEVVTLTEQAHSSGVFRGQVMINATDSPTPGDGHISTRDGDHLTVTYIDNTLDKNGNPLVATSEAVMDFAPPQMLNNTVRNIDDDSAEFYTEASEPVQITYLFGNQPDQLDNSVSQNDFAAQHTTSYIGLTPCSPYFYKIQLTDKAGNVTLASNNGSPFIFQTKDQYTLFKETLDPVLPDDPPYNPKWSHKALVDKDQWQRFDYTIKADDFAWYHPGVAHAADTVLVMPPITVLPVASKLSFDHRYVLENDGLVANRAYDGAVIEISTDGGKGWEDLGPHIIQSPYNSTIATSTGNPLEGRQAWSGDNSPDGPMQHVIVDLSSYANKPVQIRFRLACDSSVSLSNGNYNGWYVDNIELRSVIDCIGSLASLKFDHDNFSTSLIGNRLRFTVSEKELSEANAGYPTDFRLASAECPNGLPVIPQSLQRIDDRGIWEGYLPLEAGQTPGTWRISGILDIKEGDWIRLIYTDASINGAALNVTAQTVMDNTPPKLVSIKQATFSDTQAVYIITADEPVALNIKYGTSVDTLDKSNSVDDFLTTRYIGISGAGDLKPNTAYYFDIVMTDRAGNTATIDNGGFHYGVYTGSRVGSTDTIDDFSTQAPEGGYTHSAMGAKDSWRVMVSDFSHSPTKVWAADTTTTVCDNYLISPPVSLTNSSLLRFWHTYELEDAYDGAVIELSLDGGANWIDLGPQIQGDGGYNRVISSTEGSPLAGRKTWSGGAIGPMTQVVVDLSPYPGDNRLIRFRLASDRSTRVSTRSGWQIDDITFERIALLGLKMPTAPMITTPLFTTPPLPAGQSVTAKWVPGDSAQRFQVYYGTLPTNMVPLEETTGNSFDIPWWDFKSSTRYYWRVVAINDAFKMPSDIQSFVIDKVDPQRIANFLVGKEPGLTYPEQIQVDWDYSKTVDVTDLLNSIKRDHSVILQ